MKTRERIVIYGLLLGLTTINASVILGLSGTVALADPIAQDPAVAAAPPVSALTLEAEGEAEPLVVRNRGGRISWSEAPHDRVHSVAYVFIGKVLNQLMQSEDFQEERERLAEGLSATDTDYRERLEAVRGRIQTLDQESEEARRLFEEGQALYEEYVGWQQQAMAQRGRLDAEHLERSYRELIEAVEVVADRLDVDIVHRFIPTGDPFNAENPEQAMLAIRLRTALRYPSDLDMTDAVLEELSLDVE